MRRIDRRSFLVRVTGAVALGAGAGAASASVLPPRRGLCSDTDKGPNADPANAWVADRDSEPGDPTVRPEPNLSDADRGPNSDHGLSSIGFCGYKRRAA
ncbi:MAG TPA: hypothetical protein VEW04_04870 [Allosphingosinicella sp.]|nr:hypothetical protein [Allosphingosinicella sp.]